MDLITCDFNVSMRQCLLCVLHCAMIVDSDDDDSDSGHPDCQFSTPDGLCPTRKQPLLPYDPHNDQLEEICKMIDGINLMALTCTGSGKTGYFTMYMASLPDLLCLQACCKVFQVMEISLMSCPIVLALMGLNKNVAGK